MSEAAVAEIEATEVPEPETGDADEPEPEDEPTEPEPEDEPEARHAPSTEKEVEKANKALEAEAKRHADRIGVIMGDDALGLVLCEACATNLPGFHWPASEFNEGTPERSLYELLAGGADVRPKQPAFLRTCESCNGIGEWRTGSHKQSMEWITCADCGGKGYRDEREAKNAPVVTLAPSSPDAPAAPAEPDVERDMLGRPAGHPNYGLLPIYMNEEQKARDAADGFTV